MQTLGDQPVQFRSRQETFKSPKFKLLFKWVFEKILAKAAVLVIDRFFSEGIHKERYNPSQYCMTASKKFHDKQQR